MRRAAPADRRVRWPSKARCPRSPARSNGSTRRHSTTEGLKGKVVLVDFWTYSCINCLRALPYVRAWADEVRDAGPGGDRRARAGIRLREERRTTSEGPRRISRSPIRWRSTTTTRSGAPSRTSTGRRTTSSTPRAASATTTSARAATTNPSGSSSSCWPEAGNARGAGRRRDGAAPSGAQAPSERAPTCSRRRPMSAMNAAERFVSPGGAVQDAPQDLCDRRSAAQRMGPDRRRGRSAAKQATLQQAGGSIVYRFHARDLHLVLGPATEPASRSAFA